MQPHEVLDVRPDAGRDAVTIAFRRFAKQHHPDRGGDPVHFQAGVDAYRRLVGRHGADRAPGSLVFHRRKRRGIASLLRARLLHH